MTKEEVIKHFRNYPSYLTTGSPKLAKKFNLTVDEIYEIKDIVRNTNEQWEEKVRWVKDKEGSKLFVKKSQDNIKEEFLNFAKEFVPKNYNNTKPNADYSSALLVYMSDKHIGADTLESSSLENKWDKEEFENRMSLLAEEVIRLYEINKFEAIILFDLGDAVDGFNAQTTRGGHKLPQNMSNREVFSVFMEVHLNFFYTIQKYCDTDLTFITAGESNHGGDFEWICNKSLEILLNNKFPNIKTFIGDKFIEHYELGNHCFIVCHGKDIEDLKFPLPSVLNEKTELYFKRYVDHHKIDAEFIHVIKGDTHKASCQYVDRLRYKNVLSMYGASKWIHHNFMSNLKGVSMDIFANNRITEHQLFM